MMEAVSNEVSGTEQVNTAALNEYRAWARRLPVTMRPSLNQQLADWDSLFPFEQRRLRDFLHGIESFSPSELETLLRPLRTLESKMGVKLWDFSESSDTLENASMLARSPYYQDWRREVQRVFEAIESAAGNSVVLPEKSTRLIIIILPGNLPVAPLATWTPWDSRAREVKLNGDGSSFCELALKGQPDLPAIGQILSAQGDGDSSNFWLIDADARLGNLLPGDVAQAACTLNYASIKPFRDQFLAEVNTIPKNLHVTDQSLERLRRKNWAPVCPAELSRQSRLRDFVVDLFLSGNGALIFSNAFVEWAASEALRRARPRVLIARFGMRNKPKPFTSIAIFENQRSINTLPDVEDPQGSAIDALELARYIWLSALRYPEREQTCCLCVSEYCNSAYMIAPPERSPDWGDRSITPHEICAWIGTTLTLKTELE
jgi:hypothetical protein